MVETEPSEADRTRGLLSKRDRQYLLGTSDIKPRSQRERDIRADIRERVWNGLLDFYLLRDRLEPRDREQILPPREDDSAPTEQSARETAATYVALTNALAFLYDLYTHREGQEQFERVLAEAIGMIERRRAHEGGTGIMIAGPDVTITPGSVVDHERIDEKLDVATSSTGPGFEILDSAELLYLYWKTHAADAENEETKAQALDVIERWIESKWDLDGDGDENSYLSDHDRREA